MWRHILLLASSIIATSANINDTAVWNTLALNKSVDFGITINCIENIIKETLIFKPTVMYVMNYEESSEKNIFFEDLIDKLAIEGVPFVILDQVNEINEKSDIIKTDLLIIQYYDNCNEIPDLNFEHKQAKYLMVFNCNKTVKTSILISKIQQIGNEIVKYDITFMINDNVVTLIPFVNGSICSETVTHVIKIAKCHRGLPKLHGFPSKDLLNLNKCPLRICLRTLYPFAMKQNTTNLNEHDVLKDVTGMDVEIIKILNQHFNGSLELYYTALGENAMSRLDFVQFLSNGSLDICAGGLYRLYGNTVDYSGVYCKQIAVWAYYVERVSRSWQSLLKRVDGWHFFLIFYLFYSCVWYFVSMFDKNAVLMKNILLHGWGSLVGASSLLNASSAKQKILNLSYLILCIHVTAYINIQLYSFLTVNEPPTMYKSNEDIMRSGRTLFIGPSNLRITSDEKFVKFVNNSKKCGSIVDCAKKALVNKGVTALSDSHFILFQALTAVNDEARVVKSVEYIRDIPHEMVLRKDSLIVKPIQKVLQWLVESGIMEKLYIQALGVSSVGKAQLANKKIVNNSYDCGKGCEISLSQLAGVFYIWMVGCGLSVCVFIIELIWKPEHRSL